MELKQIASFQVDHTKLVEGMYTSRVDGDITTYDIRMVKPNCGTYLPYAAIHSFEHLFATYVRSTELSDQVIYVGPMGCRTGFYFLRCAIWNLPLPSISSTTCWLHRRFRRRHSRRNRS